MKIKRKLANPSDTFGFSGGIAEAKSALKKKYVLPPFSVLNTRDGYWQDRRNIWINLGIESELGRDVITFNTKHLTKDKYGDNKAAIGETSIFDPVLTEFLYTNFCPDYGQVVDPFAGGSVRGIVASIDDRFEEEEKDKEGNITIKPYNKVSLPYWGCDLSARQIEANKKQLHITEGQKYQPTWVVGDALKELDNAPQADLILACPPYGSLEVYSDDPRDISNMSYEKFLQTYTLIIRKACSKLKDNRFAIFVVASFRDKKTHAIRDLPGDTIRAFQGAGLIWWDDMVLINSAGTGPIRAKTLFENGRRKAVKLHQNVLVFLKGKAPTWEWQSV